MTIKDWIQTYARELEGSDAERELEAIVAELDISARTTELDRIDKANTGNGMAFWFEDMRPERNGWRTMRAYVPERLEQLRKDTK